MPSWVLSVLGVLIFLTVIAVSVGLHEAGHMITAKKFNLHVPKFFVGFGPTLWSFKKGKGLKGTEYGVKAIPLGGFVEIYDPDIDDENDPAREMLSNIKPWKRMVVFSAGPIVNIILGFIALVSLLMIAPSQMATTTIGTINSCQTEISCGAEQAGLKKNDKIVEIDGKKIDKHEDISEIIEGKENVNLIVERNGEFLNKNVNIKNGYLGVTMSTIQRSLSFSEAVSGFGGYLWTNIETLAELPTQFVNSVNVLNGAERGEKSVGSILTMGKAYADVSSTDKVDNSIKINTYIMWFGLVNLSLGFINLLPIGILDGSRMLISLIDNFRLRYSKINKKWKYSPVSMKYVTPFMNTGSFALIVFMGTLLITDIISPVSVI